VFFGGRMSVIFGMGTNVPKGTNISCIAAFTYIFFILTLKIFLLAISYFINLLMYWFLLRKKVFKNKKLKWAPMWAPMSKGAQ
jgi:hypothetical protein